MKNFLEDTVGDWWNLVPRFNDTQYLTRDYKAYAYIASNSVEPDRVEKVDTTGKVKFEKLETLMLKTYHKDIYAKVMKSGGILHGKD